MRDHDPVLDHAIRETALILADVICRLLLPESTSLSVDFPQTESVHVNGQRL